MKQIPFIIISIFLVNACGFTPVYNHMNGEHSPNPQPFLISIQGKTENDYLHYKMRQELEPLLPMVHQKYKAPLKIRITITENIDDIALNEKAHPLRRQTQLHVDLEVQETNCVDKKCKKPLLKTHLEAITSFSVLDTEEFVMISGETGARDRLIKDLAQQIIGELRLL